MNCPVKNSRGMVLILVFIIMTTLAAVVVAFLFMTSVQTKGTGYDISSAKALWIAEAGIQQVMYKLNTDSAYRSNPSTVNGNLGDGAYSVTVAKSGNDFAVVSLGTVGVLNRRISCTVKQGLIFAYAGFGDSSASVGTSGDTDSYDSRLGRYNISGNKGHDGDVGTNGNITTSGSAYIDGDASTGPSGTFNTKTAVYGTITHTNAMTLPAVTVPATLTGLTSGGTLSNTTTINPGNYKYAAITLNNKTVTIVGPANIYLTAATAINLSSSGKIAISASSTGPVVIYTAGTSTIGGAGVGNATYLPSYFQLFGSTNGAVSVTSSGEFYGVVHAPLASVSLTGSGAVYGSIIGKSITLNGSGGLHYDKAVSDISTGSGKLSMRVWHEIVPAI